MFYRADVHTTSHLSVVGAYRADLLVREPYKLVSSPREMLRARDPGLGSNSRDINNNTTA
jgi:hypothetical protein